MRHLKFRVWDKVNKRMWLAERLIFSPVDGTLDTISVKEYNKDDDCYDYMDFHLYPNADCKLMQFTGLHDKNGKEIYEGDICYYWPDANRQTFQVAYIGSCFRGINKDVIYGHIEDYAAVGLKIIGNIHGNPELLEAVE